FGPHLVSDCSPRAAIQKDAAFHWLERACELRDVFSVLLCCGRCWDSLRSDTRCDRLLSGCRLSRWASLQAAHEPVGPIRRRALAPTARNATHNAPSARARLSVPFRECAQSSWIWHREM